MNLFLVMIRRSRFWSRFAGFVLVAVSLARTTAEPAPGRPVITQQPISNIAQTNEDISFSVGATGTPPLQFQWLVNGILLAGQTNDSLLLTNVTLGHAGNYSVNVANPAGSVTSSNATLIVQTNIVRRLGTGRILQIGSTVGVPISFRSNGRENSISFSLAYGTNYSNPRFSSGSTNATATVNTDQAGVIGISLAAPAGEMFPAGYQWLGIVEFDLADPQKPLQGSLAFVASTNMLLEARGTTGQKLNISASVLPQYTLMSTNPVLRLQSGFFEDKLVVSNPGSTVMTNINILALNLGIDRASNAITFFNAQASQTNLPYSDPLIDVTCDCVCGLYANVTATCSFEDYLSCGNNNCSVDYSTNTARIPFAQINNLLPGESRLVTIEYHVSDHFTAPKPDYSVYLADPFPLLPAGNANQVIAIDATRYVSNSFLVEFTTVLGHPYYVQYAETVEGLVTGKTVLPPVTGTGSRVQWVDNGPPKTATPPTNGFRFYRVLSDLQ